MYELAVRVQSGFTALPISVYVPVHILTIYPGLCTPPRQSSSAAQIYQTGKADTPYNPTLGDGRASQGERWRVQREVARATLTMSEITT